MNDMTCEEAAAYKKARGDRFYFCSRCLKPCQHYRHRCPPPLSVTVHYFSNMTFANTTTAYSKEDREFEEFVRTSEEHQVCGPALNRPICT